MILARVGELEAKIFVPGCQIIRNARLMGGYIKNVGRLRMISKLLNVASLLRENIVGYLTEQWKNL